MLNYLQIFIYTDVENLADAYIVHNFLKGGVLKRVINFYIVSNKYKAEMYILYNIRINIFQNLRRLPLMHTYLYLNVI